MFQLYVQAREDTLMTFVARDFIFLSISYLDLSLALLRVSCRDERNNIEMVSFGHGI